MSRGAGRPGVAVRVSGQWFICWGAPTGGGGGVACAVPPGCAARAGPVGRGVALPHSVPLPSPGRQQSWRHWRCAVHGGRGPPYHSGSCSPGFSGYDLCGVPVRRRGLACSSRPPWEPAAGAGGRVALRLPSRAGGDHPPASGGGGRRPRGWRAGGGAGGGGGCRAAAWRAPALPALLPGGRLRYSIPALSVSTFPSGVRVRLGLKCRPGVGGGEGRPGDRSPGGPSRPEPPLCHPGVGCGYGRVMWGAASFLFRGARCSGTPVWVRGSRSSRRSPYRVAVPFFGGGGAPLALGGRRAAPEAPQLGWVRGGGVGGAAPPPALGPVWEGGGGSGGGPLVPWRRLLTAGGGGRHGSPGPRGQPSAGGSRPSPAPLYLEPDPCAGPRWGPSSPGRCRAALAGRGWP